MGGYTEGTRIFVLYNKKYGIIKSKIRHPQNPKKFVYEIRYDDMSKPELVFASYFIKSTDQ